MSAVLAAVGYVILYVAMLMLAWVPLLIVMALAFIALWAVAQALIWMDRGKPQPPVR